MNNLEEVKAALVDERAGYLHLLDENPDCSAWTFDELSSKEQADLRRDAMVSLDVETPLIFIQYEELKEYVERLERFVGVLAIEGGMNLEQVNKDIASLKESCHQ
jgi:hypothetical protein